MNTDFQGQNSRHAFCIAKVKTYKESPMIRKRTILFVMMLVFSLSAACDENTSSFSDAVDICTGTYHSCALRANGEIVCWGDNSDGQSSVAENEGYSEVECAGDYTCGVKNSGAIVCWGESIACPGGDDTHCWTTPADQPPVLSGYHDLVCEVSTCCLLDEAGVPNCWGGYSDDVQLDTPTDQSFFQLSGDGYAFCGLTEEGVVHCWGNTYFLDAEPDVIDQPNDIMPIPEGMRFSQISIQYHYGCGVLQSSATETWCWGEDSRGYLHPTGFDLPEYTSPVIRIDSNAGYKCILRQGESPSCYGEEALLDYPPDDHFVQLAYGGLFGCGILSNGKVRCWGDDYMGAASPP